MTAARARRHTQDPGGAQRQAVLAELGRYAAVGGRLADVPTGEQQSPPSLTSDEGIFHQM